MNNQILGVLVGLVVVSLVVAVLSDVVGWPRTANVAIGLFGGLVLAAIAYFGLTLAVGLYLRG